MLTARATERAKAESLLFEIRLATAQLTSLHRVEFLASKGVKNLPEIWVPAELRPAKPKFSPRAFALAHLGGEQ